VIELKVERVYKNIMMVKVKIIKRKKKDRKKVDVFNNEAPENA
jgi:hypothetical protein